MYCRNCGDQLSSTTARFCTGCGVAIRPGEAQPPTSSPEWPLSEPGPASGDPPEQKRVCVTGSCEARGLPTTQTRCDLCGAATQARDSSGTATPSRQLPAQPVGDGPRVGGWGLVIFLFGFVGGAIGWLSLKGKDPRRADHVLKWSLIFSLGSAVAWLLFWLILIAILAHAASSSSSTSFADETTTDSSAFLTPTTTEATATLVPLGDSVFAATVTGRTADGYSASADVTVYRPRHADRLPALPLSDRSTLASCTVDGTRDAVVPISVEVTNTTKGFSTPIQLNMSADATAYSGDPAAVSIEGDLQLSDGTYCDGPQTRSDGDVYSVIWNDPVAPQATVSGDFFLVIHDFYAPDHPQGDVSLLDSVELVPTFEFGPSGSQTTVSADNNVPVD